MSEHTHRSRVSCKGVRLRTVSYSYTYRDWRGVDRVSGTLEYIPPENWKDPRKEKTEKFDVYGYAISAWEIFSQKHAYYDFQVRGTISVSVEQKGMRPNMTDIKDAVPIPVLDLIVNCWHQLSDRRPSF